jgi:hypothetical protein
MHMCVTVPIVQTSPVEIGHDIKPHMLLSKVIDMHVTVSIVQTTPQFFLCF